MVRFLSPLPNWLNFWWWIWNIAEEFRIPLGRLAPHVFGLMIGAKPQRKETK